LELVIPNALSSTPHAPACFHRRLGSLVSMLTWPTVMCPFTLNSRIPTARGTVVLLIAEVRVYFTGSSPAKLRQQPPNDMLMIPSLPHPPTFFVRVVRDGHCRFPRIWPSSRLRNGHFPGFLTGNLKCSFCLVALMRTLLLVSLRIKRLFCDFL